MSIRGVRFSRYASVGKLCRPVRGGHMHGQACERQPECGGITMDGGLPCGVTCAKHLFELRSGQFESKGLPGSQGSRRITQRNSVCFNRTADVEVRPPPPMPAGLALAQSLPRKETAERHSLLERLGAIDAAAGVATSSPRIGSAESNYLRSRQPQTRAVRYIALVEGHSGSSWFCEVLSHHPCAFCNQERA
jgi:hypothetical protein